MATVRLEVDLTSPQFTGVPARGIRVAIPFIRDAGRFIDKAANEFGVNPGAVIVPGNSPLFLDGVSFYCGGNVIFKKQVTELIKAGVLKGAYISDTGIDAVEFDGAQPADWNSPWLPRVIAGDDGALVPTGDQDERFDFEPFEFVAYYADLGAGESIDIEPWGRNVNSGSWYVLGPAVTCCDATVQVIPNPANTQVFLKASGGTGYPITVYAQGQTPKTTQ